MTAKHALPSDQSSDSADRHNVDLAIYSLRFTSSSHFKSLYSISQKIFGGCGILICNCTRKLLVAEFYKCDKIVQSGNVQQSLNKEQSGRKWRNVAERIKIQLLIVRRRSSRAQVREVT